MEPGRELDKLIAKLIFDKVYEPVWNYDDFGYGDCPTCGYSGHYSALPYYSDDIAAAFNALNEAQVSYSLSYLEHTNLYRARLWSKEGESWEQEAQTLPHAICLALLDMMV